MEGLLGQLLKGTPLQNIGVSPKIEMHDIVLELTEHQFKEMICQGLDDKVKNLISIKFMEGKIRIVIRLI